MKTPLSESHQHDQEGAETPCANDPSDPTRDASDDPPLPVVAPGLLAGVSGDDARASRDGVAAENDGNDPAAGDASPPRALDVDVADPDAEALAAVPLSMRVEAALFAATEPVPLKQLKELTGCPDGRMLRDAVDALAAWYQSSARAFRIEETSQGFQLRTAPSVAVVVQRLGRKPAEERLSQAALETLAVVAYRQPVLRVDVEKIRGVACGEVLRALQERGLVRAVGRSDLPGSPILYGTTQRFLEVFGLKDLQELPKDRELLRGP